MELALFFFLAVLTVGAAIGAIAFKNPLYCALSLLSLGACSALFFVHLRAPFLGVVQMLVFAGVVLVLILAAISTMNLRPDKYAEPLSRGTRTAALVVGLGALAHLVSRLAHHPVALVGEQEIMGSAAAVGQLLFSRFALALEVVALVLLAGVVGLLVLAGRERAEIEGD